MKKKVIVLLVGFLFLVVFAAAAYKTGNNFYCKYKLFENKRAAWNNLREKIISEFNNFHQEAGIVIVDLPSGNKIAINDSRLFPSASMVKIPVMASCIYAASQGKMDLNQSIELKTRFKTSGSGVLKNYANGTKFTVNKIIEIMIVYSDNTAANTLINYVGFDTFNGYFKKLGLKNTNLSRTMMDFKSRKEGIENYTTAGDLAYLLEEIYSNKFINEECSKKCLEILKKQKIRDRIPAKLPADIVVAHKTGLEDGICHDAGIVFTPAGDFIICVLTKHNYKFAKPAKKFIAQIALAAYKYYIPESS